MDQGLRTMLCEGHRQRSLIVNVCVNTCEALFEGGKARCISAGAHGRHNFMPLLKCDAKRLGANEARCAGEKELHNSLSA
jgi:hypothetical protein